MTSRFTLNLAVKSENFGKRKIILTIHVASQNLQYVGDGLTQTFSSVADLTTGALEGTAMCV